MFPLTSRIIREVRKPNGREAYLVTLVHNRTGWVPELQLAAVRPDGRLANPKWRRGIPIDCIDSIVRGLAEARAALLPEDGSDAGAGA